MPKSKAEIDADILSVFGPDPVSDYYERQQCELLRDIQTALSWGIPSNESTGCSAYEFTALLSRARNEILRLTKLHSNEQATPPTN